MTTPTRFVPDDLPLQAEQRLRIIGEIDEFKGHWRRVSELNQERLTRLREITTIESTASSTRIEGVEMTDDEVNKVLQGLSTDSFRARDESEVLGYGELHAFIYESHSDLDLSENHIKQMHSILLKRSTKDERHKGEYKKFPNNVEATHPDGHRDVVFVTASPFDTPRLMAELIADTRAALDADELHPLTVIGCFVVNFLAIHPFHDGNGRLSRAITNLLLLRAGYEYVPYASLERVIEDSKAAYYAALRMSQIAMKDDARKFGAWLLFFLRALKAQKMNLESKLDLEGSMLRLSEIQRQILDLVLSSSRITSFEIANKLAISYRNVRYHLDTLVKRGMIAAHGERKGRYYTPSGVAQEKIIPAPERGTLGIVAEIYQQGGRISRPDLIALVKSHGYDGRVVGLLHGRRIAHLRRDPKSDESVLTTRGQEVAREFIFSTRLSNGARAD